VIAGRKYLLLFKLFISVIDESLYIIFLWRIAVRALIYEYYDIIKNLKNRSYIKKLIISAYSYTNVWRNDPL
jgi:hypothetical protein